MGKRNTRQVILDEALALFSALGYDGVSVKRIAEAVGIKDSSLYKHFKSKREIFDTIFCNISRKFEANISLYGLPQGEMAFVAKEYGNGDLVALKRACQAVFLFFLKDPEAAMFRKLLMIEQYKNGHAAQLLRSWFTDEAMEFQTALFTEMIKQGYFREGPPNIIAMQFYAPFYLLLCQYDTMPEKEQEALEKLMAHIEQFAAVYHVNVDLERKNRFESE